jgi:hypothetical protein
MGTSPGAQQVHPQSSSPESECGFGSSVPGQCRQPEAGCARSATSPSPPHSGPQVQSAPRASTPRSNSAAANDFMVDVSYHLPMDAVKPAIAGSYT